MKAILRAVGFVALFTLIAMAAKSVSANNVFDCSSNGITPQIFANETGTYTIIMPHLFFLEDGLVRDGFIELIPKKGNFSEGNYRVLFGNNIPQFIECGGFTRSTECPALEQLMCQ